MPWYWAAVLFMPQPSAIAQYLQVIYNIVMASKLHRVRNASRRRGPSSHAAPKTPVHRWPVSKNERAFDGRILRSALDFLERFYAPLVESDVADATEYFAWVPGVIRDRMAAVHREIQPYGLKSLSTAADCNDLATRFRLGIVALQERPPTRRRPERVAHNGVEEWLDKQLRVLELTVHPVYRNGAWQRVEIPALTTVQKCMAYALWVLHEDRWNIRGRVRLCPYRKKADTPEHYEPDHWFLDFDLDERGALTLGPPQRFCTPEHANAFRQREYRKRQAALRGKAK